MRVSPKTIFSALASIVILTIVVSTTYTPVSAQLALTIQSRKQEVPTRIVVERVGVNLPVQLGTYNQSAQEWQIDNTNAFFANLSDKPNKKRGNTLIYAHNYANLFAPTLSLVAGDKIDVYTNTQVYRYEVTAAQDVSPKDTSLFNYSGEPQLTLLTCSGPKDITRRLTHAKLTNVAPLSKGEIATK